MDKHKHDVQYFQGILARLPFKPSGPQASLCIACKYAAFWFTPDEGARLIKEHLAERKVDISGLNIEASAKKYAILIKDLGVEEDLEYEQYVAQEDLRRLSVSKRYESEASLTQDEWLESMSPIEVS